MPRSASQGRTAVVEELAALAAAMQRKSPPVDAGLSELVTTASRHVPGADYAGITLANRKRGISTATATHRYAVVLDEIQQRHQDGPCVTAAWEHQMIRIDDMTVEQRWPKYCRDAIEQTPIRSVLSFRLFVDQDSIAALNFYAEPQHAFEDESEELGWIFATHTAMMWTMLRRDEQFRSGLASRDIIGQAKGIIMERFNVDAVRAFELLTRLSQSSNTRLVEVAQRLIDTDHPDTSR